MDGGDDSMWLEALQNIMLQNQKRSFKELPNPFALVHRQR